MKVAAPELSAPLGSGAGGVTQGGAADGSADAPTDCAGTVPSCGLEALTFGLDLPVESDTGCEGGKTTIQ